MTFFALSVNIKLELKLRILWYTPKYNTLLSYYHLKLKTESILINNMKGGCLARGFAHSACQIILLVGIFYSESGQLPSATEFYLPLFLLCEMTLETQVRRETQVISY